MVRAAFRVELTWPPDDTSTAVLGAAKVGVLNRLKNSARNSRRFASLKRNCFIAVKSNWARPSPRRMLRPEVPYVYCAGTAKEAVAFGSQGLARLVGRDIEPAGRIADHQ